MNKSSLKSSTSSLNTVPSSYDVYTDHKNFPNCCHISDEDEEKFLPQSQQKNRTNKTLANKKRYREIFLFKLAKYLVILLMVIFFSLILKFYFDTLRSSSVDRRGDMIMANDFIWRS